MKNFIFALGCVVCVGLTSCNKNDVQNYTPEQIVEAQYKQAFVQTFGQPASNQDWGFGQFNSTTTRAVIKETHELPKGLTKPTLEEGEADYIKDWFENNEGEASEGLDWTKFFIVYVGGKSSVNIYSSWDGKEKRDNVVLDYLQINGEHINDWNANNGPTVYIYNSKADNFTAHNSYCNLTTSKWKLAKITYNGKEGYYVGLSAYGRKNETTEKYQITDYGREHFYDNWIFKIVPAEATPACRIIAEDLSASAGSDFDFNDVVFDVAYEDNNTIVKVQAAGGTLPLYVAGKEVHKLFMDANPDAGITETTMINTNASNGISGLSPVSFTITGKVAPQNIEVKVNKEGTLIPLKAEVGEPAAKIAVAPSFVWCDERADIRKVYPNFSSYVKNTNVQWY